MSLIPQWTLAELTRRIENSEPLRSVELFHKGESVGFFIYPCPTSGHTMYHEVWAHAEGLGLRGNSVLPEDKTPEPEVNPLACDQCDFVGKIPLALAGHKRTHKAKVLA